MNENRSLLASENRNKIFDNQSLTVTGFFLCGVIIDRVLDYNAIDYGVDRWPGAWYGILRDAAAGG